VIGPDTALADDGVLGAFAAARDRIWIEAFYADDPWGDRPNPFLEAAFVAARRGVAVRLLLDGSSWASEEDSSGNQALAANLNDRAHREGVDLEARVLLPRGNVERVHNKGAIIDGRTALVSSMNWAFGSATENREIGLLLDEPTAVARLEDTFRRDWEGDLPEPRDDPVIGDPNAILALYAFVAAASALSLRKMRRRDKGLKPRSGMVRRGLLRAALRRGHREVRVLPPELVAEPRDGAGGGTRDRGGREGALQGVRGPPGDRDP
jgi:phosphatidylserine/phosphatidylglycerophosphate/cardiolipin synthase-like enzyme